MTSTPDCHPSAPRVGLDLRVRLIGRCLDRALEVFGPSDLGTLRALSLLMDAGYAPSRADVEAALEASDAVRVVSDDPLNVRRYIGDGIQPGRVYPEAERFLNEQTAAYDAALARIAAS